jgi:hypothetical protein
MATVLASALRMARHIRHICRASRQIAYQKKIPRRAGLSAAKAKM